MEVERSQIRSNAENNNILNFKIIANLPLYVKIINDQNDINYKIQKSKLSLGPKIGFYFTPKINNNYNYTISFHAFLVGLNSETWNQFFIFIIVYGFF